MSRPVAILHLDESCLGNGREGENPGGGGGLIEARTRSGKIERRDFFLHEPATTNNRMALKGAAGALELLARKGARLVGADGLRLAVPGEGHAGVGAGMEGARLDPEGRADREPGAVEGSSSRRARSTTCSGPGSGVITGHPKNEYADWLAVRAAKEQRSSDGAVESGFGEWLAVAAGEGAVSGVRSGRGVRRAGGAGGGGGGVSAGARGVVASWRSDER